MTKDFIEQRQAKTPRQADARGRSIIKEHGGPPSVAEIDRLYKKSQIASNLNVAGGDGLQSKAHHDFEVKIQAPQALGDETTNGRLSDYRNDVPMDWRRAKGESARRPGYDPNESGSGFRYSKPSEGEKCTASGRDAKSSPFSSAYRKGLGEGF